MGADAVSEAAGSGSGISHRLLHFTDLQSALSILSEFRLVLSDLRNSNDHAEVDFLRGPHAWGVDDERDPFRPWRDGQLARAMARATCFVDPHHPESEYAGDWDAVLRDPRQWGYYAARGKGACLILDGAVFGRHLEEIGGFAAGHVGYVESYYDESDGPAVYATNAGIDGEDEVVEGLFKKRRCWRWESELRVVGFISTDGGEAPSIDIRSSLIGVCFGWRVERSLAALLGSSFPKGVEPMRLSVNAGYEVVVRGDLVLTPAPPDTPPPAA